tara:strand:+ start:1421 stop:2674 length:1254 start_codon:yes stop_codon:yes gene_type:complete
MSELKYFVTYSQSLDCFVKVRKVGKDEIDAMFAVLDERLSDSNYSIEEFTEFICRSLVHDYQSLLKIHGKSNLLSESLYSCVVEVYPILTIESACMHFNFLAEGGVPLKDLDLKPTNETGQYDMSELKDIRKKIESNLIGQEEAVEKMFNMFKLVNSGFESFGSAFFIGPTGVGKTHIANLIAEHYLGSPNKILKINCSEYAGPHEYAKLIGSPPGYVGSNEPGILATKAEESSQWVILFDEIEKADSKLHNLLLGFLDDGFITDNKGNILDFSNSIFLFTSNVGIHDNVGRKNVGFENTVTTYNQAKELVMDAFKREFAPEFINRIDEVIFFNQLTREDAENIAKLNLRDLPIKITKKLVSYIVDNAYSPEYGARNIKRFIKQHVTLKLADKILNGSKANKFKPKFQQGKLQVEEL